MSRPLSPEEQKIQELKQEIAVMKEELRILKLKIARLTQGRRPRRNEGG